MPDTHANRWATIERIYHDALARPVAERIDYVIQACGDDEALTREVESLLRYEPLAQTFLERPALSGLADDTTQKASVDLTGRHLGQYEVLGLLGSGGMGDVYTARDLKLGREVALKILSKSISGDPAYVRRFEEEARFASILNHPNIVTIYGVGEHEDVAYIAMEIVRGRTLRQVMRDGAVRLDTALDIAMQLASALCAAHQSGIVHRDLKPENIMITSEGLLKVLDFGIARRSRLSDPSAGLAVNTGGRTGLTEAGTILGTVGYMSPEQALGNLAGFPSDQFSFGAIVYELIAGRRAFQRDSKIATISAIVESEPDPIDEYVPDIPAALRLLLTRCLAKSPDARFADTRDLETAVRQIRDDWRNRSNADVPLFTRRRAIWLGAGAAAGALAMGTAWRYWPSVEPGSIAVLPFANRSDDANLDYLSDGVTASVIEQVAKLPVRVLARSLVFNFKGAADPVSVGKKLNADNILTGTIARSGGGLVVSVELRDVRTGSLRWNKTYQGTADLIATESDIAESIAKALQLRVSSRDRERLARRPTTDSIAYDLFMRGRYVQMSESEEDYLDARGLFEKAVARDPQFAEAFIALAGTYWTCAIDGYMRPIDAWTKVEKFIRRARTLNPEMATIHAGLGNVACYFDWDWPGAEEEYVQATKPEDINLQPELLLPYAFERWAMKRADQAVEMVQRARNIDGISPVFLLFEGRYQYHAARLAEADTLFRQGIDAHPEEDRFYFGLADVLAARRSFDEALEARKIGHALADDNETALKKVLATAKGERGYREVQRATVQLVELPKLEARERSGRYASPLDFARAYAQLGDRDRTREYLEDAITEYAPGVVWLSVDRAWDAVRGESWFKETVQKLELPA